MRVLSCLGCITWRRSNSMGRHIVRGNRHLLQERQVQAILRPRTIMTDKRSEKATDKTQTKRFPIQLAIATVFLTWPIAFAATLLAIFFAGASFREIDNPAGLLLVLLIGAVVGTIPTQLILLAIWWPFGIRFGKNLAMFACLSVSVSAIAVLSLNAGLFNWFNDGIRVATRPGISEFEPFIVTNLVTVIPVVSCALAISAVLRHAK